MKKLMIAAALVAATIGAQAEDCSEACPFGYQIKIMVMTTETTKLEAFNPEAVETDCKESICLRKAPATRRFAGFIYGHTEEATPEPCSGSGACECNEWSEDTNLVLWNYDTKAAVVFDCDDWTLAWQMLQLDRVLNNEGNTTTFEMAFDLGQLRFAGFGKVAKRPAENGKWTIKNASGFCAGLLPQFCSTCKETICGECTQTDTAAPYVWGICDNESAAPQMQSATTVAYGKWTLDWSETVYNRVLKKQDLTVAAPGWQSATPIALTPAN